MGVQSGKYAVKQEMTVTVWPAPDKDGTGDEVWRNRETATGQIVGRERVRDSDGNPVRNYPVPDGFQNFPSYDHTSHWLRVVPETGEPKRNSAGETVEIVPGSVLVEYPDDTNRLITDEYEIYLFEQAHEKTDGGSDSDVVFKADPDFGKDEDEDEEEEKEDTK